METWLLHSGFLLQDYAFHICPCMLHVPTLFGTYWIWNRRVNHLTLIFDVVSLFLCIPLLFHLLLLKVISLLFQSKVVFLQFISFITICINRFITMGSRNYDHTWKMSWLKWQSFSESSTKSICWPEKYLTLWHIFSLYIYSKYPYKLIYTLKNLSKFTDMLTISVF